MLLVVIAIIYSSWFPHDNSSDIVVYLRVMFLFSLILNTYHYWLLYYYYYSVDLNYQGLKFGLVWLSWLTSIQKWAQSAPQYRNVDVVIIIMVVGAGMLL